MFAVSAMFRGERPEIRLAKPPGAVATRDARPAKGHTVVPACGLAESLPSRGGRGLLGPDDPGIDLALDPAGVPAGVDGDRVQSPGAGPRPTALRDSWSPLILGTHVRGGFNSRLTDCRCFVARAQRTSVFPPSNCASMSALNSARRRVGSSVPRCCSAPLYCALAIFKNRESARSHDDVRLVSEVCGTGLGREEACRFHYSGPWLSPVPSAEAPCQESGEAPGASVHRQAAMALRREPSPEHSARRFRERSHAPCRPPDVIGLLGGGARRAPTSVCRGHQEKDVSAHLPGSRALSQGQVAYCRASVSSMGFGGEADAKSRADQARRR